MIQAGSVIQTCLTFSVSSLQIPVEASKSIFPVLCLIATDRDRSEFKRIVGEGEGYPGEFERSISMVCFVVSLHLRERTPRLTCADVCRGLETLASFEFSILFLRHTSDAHIISPDYVSARRLRHASSSLRWWRTSRSFPARQEETPQKFVGYNSHCVSAHVWPAPPESGGGGTTPVVKGCASAPKRG